MVASPKKNKVLLKNILQVLAISVELLYETYIIYTLLSVDVKSRKVYYAYNLWVLGLYLENNAIKQ